MKSSDSRLPRLMIASAFALLCFCVGYLTPHRPAALAQTSYPSPSGRVDDVPGGGDAFGNAIVTDATVTTSTMPTPGKSGWACEKSDRCAVRIAFRTTLKGDTPPKPFNCQLSASCFTFTGSGFNYYKEDPHTGYSTEAVTNIQIAGTLQLQPTK